MNFVVGHFLGLSQVGFYQVGNQIAALPISELAAPIRRPVYAGLSRVKDQVAAMRRVFLNGMAAQAAIVFPLTLGVVLTAPEIVRLFLGAKWVPLTWVLPVIAAYQLCNAVGEYVHVLLIVSNRQRLYALTYYITIALRIPLTIWGAVHWGLFGAAMAMLVSAMWNAAIWTAQVNRIIGLPWWSELASCWRTLISGGVMSVVVLLAAGPLRGMPALDVPVRLALESLIGGITYFAAHTLLGSLPACRKRARGLRHAPPTPVHYTTRPATWPAVTVSWRPRSGCGNTGRYRRAAAACCRPVPGHPRCCASDPSRDRTHFG